LALECWRKPPAVPGVRSFWRDRFSEQSRSHPYGDGAPSDAKPEQALDRWFDTGGRWRRAIREVGKKSNILKGRDFAASVRRIQRHNILVAGSFIMGLDTDEPGIGKRIAEAGIRSGVDVLNALFLTPLPGTRLWDEMESHGRIAANTFPEDWEYYTLTFIPLLGNQPLVPTQDRIRRHDRTDLAEHLPAQNLSLHCQAPAFIVGETNPLALEFCPEDPVLFLDVGDDILLVSVDPARKRHEKQLPCLKCFHEHDSTCRMALRNVCPAQDLHAAE